MFVVVRLYNISPIFEESLKRDWYALKNVYKSNGAFVSAYLHKESPVTYISYERWQLKELYLEVMNDFDGQIREPLEKLKSNCNDIKLLHSMELIEEFVTDDQ